MDPHSIVCPVCTLFLRPGITLKQHLTSHPKQKVIDALVKLAENTNKEPEPCAVVDTNKTINSVHLNAAIANATWHPPPAPAAVGSSPQIHPGHGNHVFIYQQSMSTTSPQANMMNVNPISQHYVYPTVFNPQIMPYVYQQQQVILSSNSLPPAMRALPFELSNSATNNSNEEKKSSSNDEGRIVEVQDDSGVDTIMETESSKEEGEYCEEATKDSSVHEEEDDVFEEEEGTLHSDYHEVSIKDNNVDQFYKPIDNEEQVGSPRSVSNSEWDLNSELNKACQTQNICNSPPRSRIIDQHAQTEPEKPRPEYFYVDQQNHQYPGRSDCYADTVTSVPFTTIKLNQTYEQSQPIYTSANILHGNENLDFVSMDDMVVINDFPSNHQVASQEENFEIASPDRSGVLMTIGEVVEPPKIDFNDQHDFEETMSRGSSHVNIRSDERMPATGELSGQESIGDASDITWNRLQYHQEGHSRIFQSYDLIGKNSWEMSDSESVDNPEIQKKIPVNIDEEANDDDAPTIVGFSGPPLNFKCPICGEGFASSKARRMHEIEKHPEKKKQHNIIGCDIDKKKVKKLVVKCKADKEKEKEQNFDNIFTNKLKLENADGPAQDTTEIKVDDTADPIDPQNLKTVCPICDCVLENSKALRKHKNDAHAEVTSAKHKCLTCGDCFKNEYKYNDHLKIHPLECRLCGKLFYRKQNIQLHMKRHLGLKPFKCEVCQKCFVTRQKHDEHKNVHTGDAPLKCNMCDEKFRRHSNLVQHRNRHHLQMKKKVRDYICPCGEIFHSKKKLAWHKEIHEAKPKACTQCSEKFLHMSSLTRHMRRAHNGKFLPEDTRQDENVECPICKGTYLRSSLDAHIKNHSGQRPFICLICNKDFTTKWNLKLHKWTHASRTSKPYKCDQCKGAFIRESDYISHINSHKSVKPYTCNYCGAQFIRKYNCLRHVKEHENKKNFNCQVCGKSFHRSYYLKDHMRVHSGIRPFSCHICGKTSTTKSNHNKHVQIHHAREPVTTEN